MKNEFSTNNVSFPEVERLIDSTRKELFDTVKRDAKYYGVKNRPGINEETLTPYLGPVKTICENLRANVLTILQPDIHVKAVQEIDDDLKRKETDCNTRTAELEHQVDLDMRELEGKTPPEKRPTNYLGILIAIAVNLSDWIFNAMSFEFLNHGLLTSIFMGLGVVCAVFALSQAILYFLRRAETDGRKFYLAAIGCFLAVCGGFWVFSGFRTRMMEETDVSISPVSFFLFNILFFAASIVIPIIFFPKKKDVEADRQLARQFGVVNERKEEIKRLKNELQAERNTASEKKVKHLAILSYTAHTLNRVTALYREAVEHFKNHNLLARQDRSVPKCFMEPVADLAGMQFNLPPNLDLPTA